jgi:hypothetical protein
MFFNNALGVFMSKRRIVLASVLVSFSVYCNQEAADKLTLVEPQQKTVQDTENIEELEKKLNPDPNEEGHKEDPAETKSMSLTSKIIIGGVASIAVVGLAIAAATSTMSASSSSSSFSQTPSISFGCPAKSNDHVKRKALFKNVMGVDEKDFITSGKFTGNAVTDFPANMPPGQFSRHSIEELRALTQDINPFAGQAPAQFNLEIFDVAKGDTNRYLVDIGANQAKPENIGANFQVASRWHCLEGGCIRGQDNLLGIIGSGAVQGEEANVSAFPGAIYRMYYLTDEQTDLLINLRRYGIVTDAIGAIPQQTALPDFPEADEDEFVKKVCVGLHYKTSITTGLSNVHYMKNGDRSKNLDDCNIKVPSPQTQTVNQIFTAALNLNRGKTYGFDLMGRPNTEHPALIRYAKGFLKASYEGTLRAAVIAGENARASGDTSPGKQKVFLTLMGCGAFQNKLEWVAELLEQKNIQDFIRDKNLHVNLIYFYSSQHAPADETFIGRITAVSSLFLVSNITRYDR